MANGQNNAGNVLILREITAPGLNQAGYGAQMKQTFKNIDDNFKILGNRDFVKGDQGYSLRSTSIPLIDGENRFTEEGIQVLKTILKINGVDGSFLDAFVSHSKESVAEALDACGNISVHSVGDKETDPENYHSMIDYITPSCVINKIEVYDPANTTDSEVIGTTNDFVFKDARFVHAGNYQNADYSDLFDYTCTVHLAILEHTVDGQTVYELGYQVLQNYPTLYYDREQGNFCWKVFGVETGIIAQGPKGTDGSKAAMHIVSGQWTGANSIPSFDAATIIHINKVLVNGTWVDASTAIQEDWVGDACIMFALRPTTGADENTPVYPFAFASVISRDGSGYGAYCDQANSIQMDQDAALVRSAFLGISYADGSLLHALFVPIGSVEGSNDFTLTPVHAIWAAPVNGVGHGVNYELHITPFKSYNEIATVGSTLANLPAPTSDSASEARLREIDSHRYDLPTEETEAQTDSVRLQLDYPQVIITGPLSGTDKIPTASLGIGTAYLDPLIDTNSTEDHTVYLEVPRIKVGTGGVVQIGANRDTNRKNNKGSLVVANIYSSLTAIAQSDDGGCDLNLVGTSGKINIGDSTLSTENYIYGSTYLYPKANGLTLLDPDLQWKQYISIRPNNARQEGTDLRLALIVADGRDGSGLLLGKQGTGIGGVYVTDEDIRIWGNGSDPGVDHNVRIESNNPSVIMTQGLDVINKGYGRITIGAPGDAVFNMATRIWEAGNPIEQSQTKEIIIPQTIAEASGSSCSRSIEFDMSMYEGKLKGGYSSSGINQDNKLQICVYTKDVAYARGPSTYIRSIDRTCYLRMYLDTGTETKTLVSTSSSPNIDITNAPVYASRTVEYTFSWTIDKKIVDCVVSKGKKPKIRIEAWFSDSWNGSGSKGASYSDHYIKIYTNSGQPQRTFSLTNTGYAAGQGSGAMRTEYDNGVLLTGLYRHRNIGLYVDGRPDSAFDQKARTLNGNIGIYASFLSGTNKKEIYTYIPLQDIFYKLYGYYPDQYDDGQEAHRAHLDEYR